MVKKKKILFERLAVEYLFESYITYNTPKILLYPWHMERLNEAVWKKKKKNWEEKEKER